MNYYYIVNFDNLESDLNNFCKDYVYYYYITNFSIISYYILWNEEWSL